MAKAIYFDMDGTLANLYGVEDWLSKLRAHDATPYAEATVLLNMQALAHRLNRLQRLGYTIGVISWASKGDHTAYDAEVAEVKRKWLAKHLPSVEFDELHFLAYGTPKYTVAEGMCFLVDDEERNRREWVNNGGIAVDADELFDLFRLIKEGL